MSKPVDYIPREFESSKFAHLKPDFYAGLDIIKSLGYETEDFIHYFPAFTGHFTLSRYLAFYEIYKMVLGTAGHVAEVGVYKGAVSLFFAKLIQLFEPNSLTQVHGFDWFQGTRPSESEAAFVPAGGYAESFERVSQLIAAQKLDHVVKLHNFDLTSSAIDELFATYPHLKFKIVFMDAGLYDVCDKVLPILWERLVPGGIMVFDQYNFDLAPGETQAVDKYLPRQRIRTFPFAWMPNAFTIKEEGIKDDDQPGF